MLFASPHWLRIFLRPAIFICNIALPDGPIRQCSRYHLVTGDWRIGRGGQRIKQLHEFTLEHHSPRPARRDARLGPWDERVIAAPSRHALTIHP